MKRITTLLLPVLMLLLSSHELFLKTDSYFLKENQAAELYLFNGTFDNSENTITRNRITAASITGPGYRFKPEETDYYDKDEATFLKFKTGKAGTYLAGVSTLPRTLKMSAEDFKGYLEHEGLTDVLEQREKDGTASQPAHEQYAKHVKAILQVGEKQSKHYSAELGYPVEFVPLQNPCSLAPGQNLRLKLLANGKPLPNQVVHYSSRGYSENPGTEEQSLRTDENGEFSIELAEPGKWYVATIHIMHSDKPELDYVSEWATLTFEVRQ